MRLIKPDFHARVAIEGIADAVARPVNIDQYMTGFERLRTLRVYQFSKEVPVEGHAEEDELIMVVLSGSLELKLTANRDSIGPVRLDGAQSASAPCAAYLPPHGEYRLVPTRQADVAYVRARPQTGRLSCVFTLTVRDRGHDLDIIVDEATYAEKLSMCIARVRKARVVSSSFDLPPSSADRELLIHLQNLPDGTSAKVCGNFGEQISMEAWDTLALGSGEQATLEFPQGAAPLMCAFASRD